MKVHMNGPRRGRRGDPVRVGNVYACQRTYAIVVGIMDNPADNRPYNKIICLRVDALGNIVGCERCSEVYCREHRDLVGFAPDMPDFSVTWIEENEPAPKRRK